MSRKPNQWLIEAVITAALIERQFTAIAAGHEDVRYLMSCWVIESCSRAHHLFECEIGILQSTVTVGKNIVATVRFNSNEIK